MAEAAGKRKRSTGESRIERQSRISRASSSAQVLDRSDSEVAASSMKHKEPKAFAAARDAAVNLNIRLCVSSNSNNSIQDHDWIASLLGFDQVMDLYRLICKQYEEGRALEEKSVPEKDWPLFYRIYAMHKSPRHEFSVKPNMRLAVANFLLNKNEGPVISQSEILNGTYKDHKICTEGKDKDKFLTYCNMMWACMRVHQLLETTFGNTYYKKLTSNRHTWAND